MNSTPMILVRCGSQYTDVLEFYCYSIGGAKEFLKAKEKEGLFLEAERVMGSWKPFEGPCRMG